MSKYGKIYYGSTLVGDVNMPPIVGNFGGLSFSPGPMYITSGGERGLCNSFSEHCSYGAMSGNTPGYTDGYRTYFILSEIGNYFDSAGSNWYNTLTTYGDHTINNQGNLVYGADNSGAYYSDWRLPTNDNIQKIFFPVDIMQGTLTRSGSTVNGVSNVTGIIIRVQHSTILPVNNIVGILAFPDGQDITGANIMNNSAFYCSSSHIINPNTGYPIRDTNTYPSSLCPLVTETELNEFLKQGCAFLPMLGRTYLGASTSTHGWTCYDVENPTGAQCADFYYSANIQGSLNSMIVGYVMGMDNSYCFTSSLSLWPQTGGLSDLKDSYVPVYLVRTYGSGEG